MGNARMFGPRRVDKSIFQRLRGLNWSIVIATMLIGGAGVIMLYSVGTLGIPTCYAFWCRLGVDANHRSNRYSLLDGACLSCMGGRVAVARFC